MKAILSSLALFATLALAQDDSRCDAPYPKTFCNTTEILAYETSDCRPFHVFITRGSDEPYPGRLGNLTKEICSSIGGTEECGFESVQYPAKSTAWGVDEWCKSAGKGAKSGQAQVKAYAEKCPDAKLILLGFSQGAAVTQDILGGGGGHVFECDQDENPAIDTASAPGSNIIAAVTFGAVVRSRNQNFTIGDGKPFDGRRARTETQLAALTKYADVFLDYCHYGDPMCAVGSDPADVYVHLDYFLQHNEEVVKYVSGAAAVANGSASDAPSKPSSASGSASSGVAAKPAATGSQTPQPIASDDATKTNGAESKSAQTGNAQTGAASSLGVNVGYLGVLVAGMAGALM